MINNWYRENFEWCDYFIRMAHLVASKSKDPSTKVGCVIAGENRHVLSTGFNGFPRRVNDTKERYNERETKLNFICHADMNAILQAARVGISINNCLMFLNVGPFPCQECSKAIIQSGIKAVIGEKLSEHFAGGRWDESINYANQMLNEAGVERIQIDLDNKKFEILT